MHRILLTLMTFCMVLNPLYAANNKQDIQKDNLFPRVQFTTSMGSFIVELNRMNAPLTVDNFLQYVVNGEYDNTIFHRVIKGFVVQGGGLDTDKKLLPNHGTVVNESGNGLTNDLGTIAMARENDPHSANRQFYFNMDDNTNLDPHAGQWGYAVFGMVDSGNDVLEQISQVKTHTDNDLGWEDVPVKQVVIKKVELLPEQ